MSFSLVQHVMQHEGFTKNKDICTVELKQLHLWLTSTSYPECLKTLPSILISSEECLTHTDKKIRLLLACCLTQVLRICDQNNPFSTIENLEIALIFILSQLVQGIQSLDTEEQELSLQLLQYLITINVFRWSRLIKNGHEIVSSMLSVMIPIAEQASVKQHNLILQTIKDVLDDPVLMMEPKVLMSVAESIVIGPRSNLATVLILREAEKPAGKAMTELLKYLLQNADVGNVAEEDKRIPLCLQGLGVYVLTRELYSINPKLVQPIYPVLAMRLRSMNCDERKECLNVVIHLLICDEANVEHPLFSPFLGRSSDVNVSIRLQAIHGMCQLVQVLPKFVSKVINTLHERTSDPDNVLKCELAAVCTQIMLQNDSALELLLSLRTLSNDQELRIQIEAICGMVKVYKQHLTDHSILTESNRDYAQIIFNTLMSQHLHTDVTTSKHIIENLLYTYIFPNTQSVPKYMERLLFFLCGANAKAIENFQSIHVMQKRRKEAVLRWISQRKEERMTNKNIAFNSQDVEEISQYFPGHSTKIWCLKALDFVLAVNENCYTSFTTILEEHYGSEADKDMVMCQLIDIASLIYSECTIQVPRLRQLLASLYQGEITTEHIQTNQEKAAVEYLKSLDHCIKTVDEFLDHQKTMQTTIEERFNTSCAIERDHDAHMEKLQKHQEMARKRADKLKQEIDKESGSAVTSIIDMAVTLAESSNVNRGVASERLKRECSLLFEQGLPIKSMVESLEDLLDEDFIHSVSSEDLRLEVQRQLTLNQVQLKEYLQSRVSSVTLGHIVHRLLGFKYPRPPPPPGANMPWMPVMALIVGLSDAEVMGNLVEVLSQQQVTLVVLDDAVETCIEAYRREGPGLPLLESKDPPPCTEEPPSVPEVQMLLRHTLLDEHATATGAGDSPFADKETQTGPEVTPVLSLAASLGKQGLETLRLQQPLSDWLKVAVLIEHLKHITSNTGTLGWVLADFPQTFEQAALFETAISGQHVPNPDLKDEEENYSKVTLYQSQIVCDPSAPHSCNQPFKTTLTSVVSLVQSDFEQDPEFVSLIEELYLRQGVHSYLRYEQWTPEVMANLVELLVASRPNDCDSSEPPVPSTPTAAPDFDIPPPLALGLAALWENLEITYLTNLHRSFFSYRAHKQRIDRYIGEVREKFAEFLARPDDLQGILQKFQENYQQMPASKLKQLEVKSELHDHVKTLQETLCEAVNLKHNEAEKEVRRIAGEPWLSRELGSLLSIATMLIQLELDRFIDTVALLQDYCMTSLQITPPDASKSLRFEVPKTLNTQVTDEWASNIVETLVSLDGPQTVPDPFTSHLDSLLQGAKAHLEKIIGGIRSSISKLETQIKPKPAASKKEKLVKKGKGKKGAPTINDVKPLEDLEAAMLITKKLQLLSDWLATCNSETELTMQRLQLTCDMACSEAKDLIHQVWSSFFLVARDAYEAQCKVDCHSATILCEFLDMAVEAGASLEAPLVLPRKSTYLQYLKNPTMFQEFTVSPRDSKLAQKLRTLIDILQRISSDGYVLKPAFDYILNQAKTSSYLPSDWHKLSSQDISNIVDVVSPAHCINWKNFMVRLLNLPVPTQRQLLMARANLLQHDPAGRGTITKEQFLSCRLWLEEAFEDKLDCIATKETLFLIFSNPAQDQTNYKEFLLSCCHDPNPALGFAKACAVHTGSLVVTDLQSEDDSEMDHLLSEVNLKFPESRTIHLDIAELLTWRPFTDDEHTKQEKKLERAFRDAEEASLTVEQRRARQRALAIKGKVDNKPVTDVVASFLLKNPDMIELVTPFFQTFSMPALVKKFTTSNPEGEATTL